MNARTCRCQPAASASHQPTRSHQSSGHSADTCCPHGMARPLAGWLRAGRLVVARDQGQWVVHGEPTPATLAAQAHPALHLRTSHATGAATAKLIWRQHQVGGPPEHMPPPMLLPQTSHKAAQDRAQPNSPLTPDNFGRKPEPPPPSRPGPPTQAWNQGRSPWCPARPHT